MSHDVYSFDVFDTLITRTTATPHGIFYMMQEYIQNISYNVYIPKLLCDNFASFRIEAEAFCRLGITRENQDITLYQIYESIQFSQGMSTETTELLIELELYFEENNILPIMYNIEMLKVLYKLKKKVFLISDMYLSSSMIKRLLCTACPDFQDIDIQIYSSADVGKSKTTGDMFLHIAEVEGVSFTDWNHIGDNLHSDVEVPSKLGIVCTHFFFPPLLAQENDLIHHNTSDVFAQISIGASRNSRLTTLSTSRRLSIFGSSLAGPMLFPYVDWVIAEALKNGINRLYFVARDGYILQKIANIIIKEKRLRLRTQYIYGSRQAWRLPALTADNIDKLIFSNFFYAHDAPSLEEFADFFGLTLSDIIAAFPEGKALARKNIPPNQYEPFRAAILRNRKIIDKILRFCKGKKDVLVAYLRQECNFVDNNFAFVELCGSGATQDCLADIILSCFPSTLCKTFYFDLSQQNNNVPGNSIKLLMFPRSGAYKDDLLEIMCRAPHGQTIGYKEHNGHIEPTLSGIEGVKIVEWGFCHYISGIEQYVKNIVSSLKNNDWLKITTNQYAFYHRRLAVFPDREFAEIMGRVPFSGSATQKEPGEYAPVFSLAEAVGRFLLNRIPPVTWWKGSIARGTKRISVFILKLRSLYYMARRFIFYVSRDSSSITVCILGIVFCVKK